MTKFKLGQEVFVIEESLETRKTKCLDCNGEGSIPSMVKDKKFVCPNCKGTKKSMEKKKKKYNSFKATIDCITIFDDYVHGDIIEEYTISVGSEIYSTNIDKTIDRIEHMSFNLCDAGYNNISVNEKLIKPIKDLYESKDKAIEECKKLKESI